MNPLLRLLEHGQSYWLDNLTRGMIADGSLARRIEVEGLRGVTSNPAIFHQAITAGREYDEQIERLVREGHSASAIYERLVVEDIRSACDVLAPVHEATRGADGFVSLEVSPYLAHDTEGSLDEARRLFRAVDRPNVLIKIPGTPAGVPAIEEALFEGIGINITLLFSIESYEAVAEAYLRALERRREAGLALDGVSSVASFFLSRIDVLVDQLLGHRIVPDRERPQQLMGRAAVANAKLAYRSFRGTLASERWKALEAMGARPQRMLWASTSTKDPLYDDVRYVEPLIGPYTVNTMPEETVSAFLDHGRAALTVEEGLEEARDAMESLASAGIDFGRVTAQLQDEGVVKFIAPFDRLLGTLADRRREHLGGSLTGPEVQAGDLGRSLDAALSALDARQFGRRLAARDATLWTQDEAVATAVADRLGWLDAPQSFRERIEELRSFALGVREEGIRDVVLLGMGGSSLCAEVCRDAFGPAEGWPELHVLDDTDPDAVVALERTLDLDRALFVVASKSGTTTETDAFYRYFFARAAEAGGEAAAGRRFVAITDPGTPLEEEAERRGFRRLFLNPPDIGGRYSALSYFGLVPMALLGIELERVLDEALHMARSTDPGVPAAHDPAIHLGALLGLAARRGRDKATLLLSESLRSFGAWAEQLLAESSGKEGRGIVPVDGEPLEASDVGSRSDEEGSPSFSPDRVFLSMRLEGEPHPWRDRLETLAKAGHPVARIELRRIEELAGEFFRWEVAAATACAMLGVNAFDEPNVTESKRNTAELLERWEREGGFSERDPSAADERMAVYGPPELSFDGTPAGAVRAFFEEATEGEYVAILPYCRRTPGRHEALQSVRRIAGRTTGAPTTLGYGPRYLHSTGQLHKGGPATGRFLLITAGPEEEAPIPGRPYGFGTLQRAQALGDWRALRERARPVLRLHLHGRVEEGLRALANALQPSAREPADVA